MKILHFEDDPTQSLLVEKRLSSEFPEIEYLHEDAPYCACPIVALDRPDVLICDYQFRHATLKAGLLDAIRKFKGLIYILSGNDPETIRSLVPDLPANVKIFSKMDMAGLVEDIRLNIAVMA